VSRSLIEDLILLIGLDLIDCLEKKKSAMLRSSSFDTFGILIPLREIL
jgi:hypothetical protein